MESGTPPKNAKEEELLNSDDIFGILISLLNSHVKKDDTASRESFPYLAWMRLFADSGCWTDMSAKEDQHLSCKLLIFLKIPLGLLYLVYHLINMNRFLHIPMEGSKWKDLGEKTTSTTNVYVDSNRAEAARCSTALEGLRRRVEAIRNEFPENIVLSNILETIQALMCIPIDIPLMKLCALLEKVLGT